MKRTQSLAETKPISDALGSAYDLLSDLKPTTPAQRLALAEMQDRLANLAFALTLFWHEDANLALKRLGGVE